MSDVAENKDALDIETEEARGSVCATDLCPPCTTTKDCGPCATGLTSFIISGLYGVGGVIIIFTGGTVPMVILIGMLLFLGMGLYLRSSFQKSKDQSDKDS
ncbi:MAG: hypothetical protein COA45_06825 [Zetaproteobacteria bacterium]|nr:MAG: hypothetical protein COA45_06825 [Zetaproteobacteria bacterium]